MNQSIYPSLQLILLCNGETFNIERLLHDVYSMVQHMFS